MKTLSVMMVLAVGVSIPAFAQASADRQRPWDRKDSIQPGVKAEVGEGVGTVRYDPGAPADAFGLVALPDYNYWFGNSFDTRNGAPLSPGTITNISWYHGQSGASRLALLAAASPGETILASSVFVSTSYTFLNVPVYVSAPYGNQFVGVAGITANQVNYFGSVGLRSATNDNQGFHGVQRSFRGNSVTLPGQNAMVRVSGTIIVPVELMEFDLE